MGRAPCTTWPVQRIGLCRVWTIEGMVRRCVSRCPSPMGLAPPSNVHLCYLFATTILLLSRVCVSGFHLFSRYGNEVDGCLEGHGSLVFKDGRVYEVSNNCLVEYNYMWPCLLDVVVLSLMCWLPGEHVLHTTGIGRVQAHGHMPHPLECTYFCCMWGRGAFDLCSEDTHTLSICVPGSCPVPCPLVSTGWTDLTTPPIGQDARTTHMCTRTYIHANTYLHMHTHTHTHTQACQRCGSGRVCLCVCVCVCVCVCGM